MSERKADPRVKRVYVCQASYASCVPQSSKQFWTAASTLYNGKLYKTVSGGSLLANCFNQFWTHALNLQEVYEEGERAYHKGLGQDANPYGPNSNLFDAAWLEGWRGTGNFTHFAMLHDDIVPENDWLDTLLEDLLLHDADMVSAVSPIKDGFGLTSTAIDSLGDNPFDLERRLTMTEVMRLPEVFSAADCGYPDRRLLLNTGCWVADFTKPWRHNVRFTIQDRIKKDNHGRWRAEVSSEDWQFSRDIQNQGAKVLATRRCRLTHFGNLPFANYGAWGEWDHDKVSAHKFGGLSIGDRTDRPLHPLGWHSTQDNLEFRSNEYADVPGWLTDDEGRYLRKLAEGKRVLEIGSYCGRSTIWIGTSATEVHCIDTWAGDSTPAAGMDMFAAFKANLQRYHVGHKVFTYRGHSSNVINLVPGFFDMVFIDGDHTYPSVKTDIELALKVLSPGGILVFHDYDRACDPGVKQAIQERFRVKEKADVGSLLAIVPDQCKI